LNVATSISVIIVNYNAGPVLAECVTSIKNAGPVLEIIIVDNASVDDSLDRIGAAACSGLTIKKNPSNLGFAVGCNVGTKIASGDCLLYLNPDCILDPNAIDEMITCMKVRPDAGMVGGLLLNPDGTEQAGGRRAVPTPWRSFVRAFGLGHLEKRYPRIFSDYMLHRQPLPEHPIEVEAISGSCMLVRREAVADVGLMDEGYFMHCEDLDWCMRFRQKEWKILFGPHAKVVHHQGTCSRSRPIFVAWSKHKGMMRFYGKFFRHQYPGALMWLVALGIWTRFVGVMAYHSIHHVLRWVGFGRG